MLYLDYAKKTEEGYILNFFADSEDDIKEVSGGKEFITKNGTNYGAPLPSSTVVITMPDKSRKTYILDDGNNWVVGGEPSGVAVEANVETADNDEELVSLKVGDKTYKNSKMIPYKSTVLPSDEVLKAVEYDKKIYQMPKSMTPANSTALVTGGVLETAEYDGKIYNVGGFGEKNTQEILIGLEDAELVDGVYKRHIKYVIYRNGTTSGEYDTDLDIYSFLSSQFNNPRNVYSVGNSLSRYYCGLVSGSYTLRLYDGLSGETSYFVQYSVNKVELIEPMYLNDFAPSLDGKIVYNGHDNFPTTANTFDCILNTYKVSTISVLIPILGFTYTGTSICLYLVKNSNSSDVVLQVIYDFGASTSTVTELGPLGGDGLVPYTGASVPGTDLKQVEYKGTVYNVGGSSSGGTQTILLEGTYTEQTVEEVISVDVALVFDSREEYINMCKEYIAGNINIRIVAKPTTSNASTFIYDVVFINDMTYTNGNTGYYLYTAIPHVNINWTLNNV